MHIKRVRELFDYNWKTGDLSWRTTGEPIRRLHPRGYYRVTFDGKQFLVHRLIWFYLHGRWPSDEIDHVNGIPTDNRLSNLREASHSQNMKNRKKHNNQSRSPLKGVKKCRSRWGAQIMVDGDKIHLGVFNTQEEAYEAYCNAAKIFHGEFARMA